MFLFQSIKRVIKELPKVDKEAPDEGWYQWVMDMDDSNFLSRNYNPSSDPTNPANPAYYVDKD